MKQQLQTQVAWAKLTWRSIILGFKVMLLVPSWFQLLYCKADSFVSLVILQFDFSALLTEKH